MYTGRTLIDVYFDSIIRSGVIEDFVGIIASSAANESEIRGTC